jgi:glycosyltransferase involved in cell wall biosynthesis
LRIVFVTRRYWPAIGGIERVAVELARALHAGGQEVEVVAQRIDEGAEGWLTHTLREAPPFAPFEHDGISVRQFRLPLGRRVPLLPLAPEGIPLLPRLTSGHMRIVTGPWYGRVARPILMPLLKGADIAHVLGGAWASVAAVEAARALKIPVVVTPFVHPGFWRDDPASVRSYQRADRVLATLESDAEDLRRLGVAPDKIEVCGLPVPPVTTGRASHMHETDSAPLVLFVGARVPHKGIDRLREAARRVWAVRPDTRFAYVGPGAPLNERDERELDVGPVSDGDRGKWFERATLLCLPSSTESFGLVVAEAWSVHRPAVTSEIPVLRELIESAGGGLSVSREPDAVAAAIVSLLADPATAQRMGDAGFEYWQRKCRPQAVAERHLEVYDAVLRRATRH